jgi:hypothetical protein
MRSMRLRLAKWAAWSLFALAVALTGSAILLAAFVINAASSPDSPLPPEAVQAVQLSTFEWILTWVENVMSVVPLLAFSALGALIVSRYPTHAIGWIFCVLGVLGALEPFAVYYAIYALFVAPGTLPEGVLAAWLQNWVWVVSIALICAFLPFLFPAGGLVSGHWRPAWWLAIGATAVLVLYRMLDPGPLGNRLDPYEIANPLAVARLGDLYRVFFSVPLDLLHASMLVAAASLVVRLRRARGYERQQIKWFAYFGAAVGALEVLRYGMTGTLGLKAPFVIAWAYPLIWPIALTGLALAAGLSILRYRLYDIDLIIRLTLVYGTLSALLAGAYLALVLAAQAAVQGLTGERGEQPVVIITSTLLVVALFTPLRRGVQAAIDRRFYRRKADAERTLAAFGAALGQEVDLERLRARLVAVVEATMQPAHASLWLRAPGRAARESHGPS